MLGKEEIRDICVNKLSFHDNKSFNEFYADRIKNGTTDEELELLAPEVVNLRHFWELCDEILHGSICGAANKSEEPPSVEYANYMNWSFAVQMGVTSELTRTDSLCTLRKIPFSVLEIGPGHGCLFLYNYYKNAKKYHAVDVYPRIPQAIQIDGSTLPESVLEDRDITTVIASNVFQHLSVEQRKHYYSQIFGLLSKSNRPELSSFTFTIQSDVGQPNLIRHNGRAYITHMGMYTECQKQAEIQQDVLDVGFYIRTATSRGDGCLGLSVYIPQAAPEPVKVEAQE